MNKHEKLLGALLESPTIESAALAAGVSRATALRYLKEPEFAADYRSAKREVVGHSIVGLQGACASAVATLKEVCEDVTAPASARISAAKTILDTSQKSIEIDDLGARVELLEAMAEKIGEPTT